ncbi:unnamed protein product [Diplocarpon coronariae]
MEQLRFEKGTMSSPVLQTVVGEVDSTPEIKISSVNLQQTTNSFSYIHKLALEVRAMVYIHELGISPGKQAPALLIVLGTGGKNWKSDYDIAQKQYRKHNFFLSVRNQIETGEQYPTPFEMRRFENEVESGISDDAHTNHIDLQNARALCQNQISTVTLDYTKDYFEHFRVLDRAICRMVGNVLFMAVASGCGIDKIVVVLRREAGLKRTQQGLRFDLPTFAHWAPLQNSINGDTEVFTCVSTLLDLEIHEKPVSDVPTVKQPLRKIPIKIRKMICAHELALAPGQQVSALLLGLGTDRDYKVDYYEAQKLHRKLNHVLTIDNQEAFKKKPRMALGFLSVSFLFHEATLWAIQCIISHKGWVEGVAETITAARSEDMPESYIRPVQKVNAWGR